MSTKLVAKDSLRNLSGSEAGPDGPDAEGVDTITGDMMKYLTRWQDLCLHQLSPGLCILFRRPLDHLTGLLVQGICLLDHARALVLSFAVRM